MKPTGFRRNGVPVYIEDFKSCSFCGSPEVEGAGFSVPTNRWHLLEVSEPYCGPVAPGKFRAMAVRFCAQHFDQYLKAGSIRAMAARLRPGSAIVLDLDEEEEVE